jgi:hypothetical protein
MTDEKLVKLQEMIMGMPFIPFEQRKKFANGIIHLPPDDLNRFLELLVNVYCEETKKLLKVFEILSDVSNKIGGSKNDRK